MLQINAHKKRKGFDGEIRSWRKIERDFKKLYAEKIDQALKTLRDKSDAKYHPLLDWCIEKTPNWLTDKPTKLEKVKNEVDEKYKALLSENKKFRDELLGAYGYEHSNLLELARWLNVKTCPYCNMQYTLCAEAYKDGELVEKMAKFQYDHFFDKAEYPMLSMSLYNLIPSCASCNQGKSKRPLSMAFHPYSTAIKDTFRFRVKDPSDLLAGGDDEKIEIKLVPQKPVDVDAYNEMFHIESLYQRHRDVAREVFARAYVDRYYEDGSNFEFLQDSNFMERLEKGFYPDEEDIDKRPLTKLQQDLWNQAKGEL